MPNFNLDDYEPVENRIRKFYAEHPDGSITTELVNPDTVTDHAVVCALVWIGDDLRATGYAMELRDTERQKNRYGKEYETVNYSSWLENSETSAIGRALANFNYAGSKRPSREEMSKVQRAEEVDPKALEMYDDLRKTIEDKHLDKVLDQQAFEKAMAWLSHFPKTVSQMVKAKKLLDERFAETKSEGEESQIPATEDDGGDLF